MKVWTKPEDGHHPHGLHPPDELRQFLVEAAVTKADTVRSLAVASRTGGELPLVPSRGAFEGDLHHLVAV